MRSAAGLGKGSLKANQRGSVWPCGEMRGRSRTVSYSLAATERASPLAGNSLFASRIFILTSSDISRVLKRQHRKPIKDFAAPRTNAEFSVVGQIPAFCQKRSTRGGNVRAILRPSRTRAMALIRLTATSLLRQRHSNIAQVKSQIRMASVVTPESGPVGL